VRDVVGRRKKRGENIIKKIFRHAGYVDEKWIKLAEDRT